MRQTVVEPGRAQAETVRPKRPTWFGGDITANFRPRPDSYVAKSFVLPSPLAHSKGRSQTDRVVAVLAQLAADILALAAAVAVAGLLAWEFDTHIRHVGYQAFGAEDLQQRIGIWCGLAIALCGWFALTGTYTTRRVLNEDVKRILGALFVVMMIDGFLEFARHDHFSRLWIFLVWPAAALLLPFARIAVRRILDKMGIWRIGAAVLGHGEHYGSVEFSLMRDSYLGYYVAYHSHLVTDPRASLADVAAKLSSDMRLRGAETVIMVPSEREMTQVGRMADALNLNLTPYVLIPPIQRLPHSGLTIQTVVNSDAIMLTSRNGLISPVRQAAKRGFDLVLGLVLLVFLLPLYGVLAAVISANGGAPIYGHTRIGRGGRAFRCLKFRTMVRDADHVLAELLAKDPEAARQWHLNFKLDDDPRITPIGKFLRKTSLDELPQLINVLRGEMSFVGPRPVVAAELQRYYGDDVFYYHLVRPGITGLWQVSGRSRTTYERRVFLDSWYVRNWNLWTDLVILFNTVPSVLARDGAV